MYARAAIALLLAAVLWLLRRRSANHRYVACGAALVIMALCPLMNLWYVRAHPLIEFTFNDSPSVVSGTVSQPIVETEIPLAVETPTEIEASPLALDRKPLDVGESEPESSSG